MDKLILFVVSLITNGMIVYCGSTIFKNYSYSSIQSLHQGTVLRLGGISIYLVLVLSIFFTSPMTHHFISSISFSLLPLFLISVREDLKHDVRPYYRLFFAGLSACIAMYFFGTIQNIDLPFLSSIFQSPIFLFILTVTAFAAMTHGFNMIDGLNGLAVLTYWAILTSIYVMSFQFSDNTFQELIWLGLSLPLGFFVFNYPFGKIFLGDTGAYLLGFICSALIIYFFNAHPQLLSWQAILILIYPVTEVIYTFVRRLMEGLSPLEADNKHLHTFLYQFLTQKITSKKYANNLATLCMFPFLIFGPVINLFIPMNPLSILIATIFFVSVYAVSYKYFASKVIE
jgi:UDP-GlcNAc:undecaprenyl-phosphate GlcNAc-1-phosphate transferase